MTNGRCSVCPHQEPRPAPARVIEIEHGGKKFIFHSAEEALAAGFHL